MDITKIKLYPGVIDYVVDEFVDYAGKSHMITVAAVDVRAIIPDFEEGYCGFVMGVSICNPVDEYVEIIGANRAAKNAYRGSKTFITGSFKGVLSENLVNTALWNEIDFIKNNINLYIRGYNESEKKYNARIKRDKELIQSI